MAKLRLHTETTVRDLENSTSRLGNMLRKFQEDVCTKYQTFDLPSEEAARGRRKAKKEATAATAADVTTSKGKAKESASGSRKVRTFNLNTYKVHALGGYAKAIRRFGSPDNYNSQTGELEHRRGKRHFKTVRKGYHVLGIGIQVRRERLIHRLRERNKLNQAVANLNNLPTLPFEEQSDLLPPTLPTQHHHISINSRHKVQLSQWLHKNSDDPAILVSVQHYYVPPSLIFKEYFKDFLPRLKNHFLSRLLGHRYDGDELNFSSADRRNVLIMNNGTIYQHKVLRVNYTTYDLRRGQDSLNPRIPGHADVMVLSPENEGENEDPHPSGK